MSTNLDKTETIMYKTGKLEYIGRSDKQLLLALSLLSVNEYDREINIKGYIIDGEVLHFMCITDDVKDINILPSTMNPTELLSIIKAFIENTDTEDGYYDGEGSLNKGFKIFNTDRGDLKYNYKYKFSVKPIMLYYSK